MLINLPRKPRWEDCGKIATGCEKLSPSSPAAGASDGAHSTTHTPKPTSTVARRPPWVLMKEEGMNDRTKADKAWEARQEAARYRIFNAATNAAEATDEADDKKYFAVLDLAGNAAEAAAAEITGYKTYADLLEALDTRRKPVLAP